MNGRSWTIAVLMLTATSALLWAPALGQHQHHGGGSSEGAGTRAGATPAPSATSGVGPRVTMDELHQGGGVPRGWTFTMPPGDAARGKRVFADLECYKCHTVKDAGFPAAAQGGANVGPELTDMGAHHPTEYFAESILNPNAVLLDG
ncbi:MAG: c-type cytochrome, partial [Candidatus Rokubacteria bacterium]|nr:c-type cytochrome [Candidatus Rokubacteria bacterium]